MPRVVSKKTRKKLSNALKGKPKSEEHKENMRKPKSPEHKAKIAAALKGRAPSEACIEANMQYHWNRKEESHPPTEEIVLNWHNIWLTRS